uniref:Uncharacterized protein n=1 Tax=viral metagenome TaxID=1070528 RepID=A0A6M3IUT8_9ZZZZ
MSTVTIQANEYNYLLELAARLEWMCDLLDMQEVSDFALSFPEVRKLDDIMRPWRPKAKTAPEP